MTTIGELDRRYYPDLVDEHARFDAMIRRYLRPEAAALDAGAGRGAEYPYDYARHITRMAGADREAAVLENPNLTEESVRLGLEGNLCRCTGYQNIVKAILAAAEGMRSASTPAGR